MATNITQEGILTDLCVQLGVQTPNSGEAIATWVARVASTNAGRQRLGEAATRALAADREGCKGKLWDAIQAESAVTQ